MKKKCLKCGEIKDIEMFYTHPKMIDGHINKCKACTKIDVHDNYKKNKVYYQAYDRERNRDEERKKRRAIYERNHREKYPEKYKARTAVNNAIRDGRLKKEPCCICGSMFSQAHHEDYSKPLDVKWYCKQCHPITGRPTFDEPL